MTRRDAKGARRNEVYNQPRTSDHGDAGNYLQGRLAALAHKISPFTCTFTAPPAFVRESKKHAQQCSLDRHLLPPFRKTGGLITVGEHIAVFQAGLA